MGGNRSAALAVCVLCGLALAAQRQARAASGPVLLHVDACFAANEASLVSVLSVEIGRPIRRVDAAVAEAAERDNAAATVVIRVSCESAALIDVQARGAGLEDRRRVDLAAVDARVHGRVVALAAAEFFDGKPAAPLPPAPVVTPPQPKEIASLPPPQRTRVVSVHALGRRFMQSQHTTWGGGVGFWAARNPWLGLWVDATAEQGRAARAPGDVRLRSLSSRMGASWQRSFEPLGVALGAGAVLGYVQARGQPNDGVNDPGTVAGLWAAALVRADVFYDLGRVRLQAFAEGGQPFVTIRGRLKDLDQELWRNPWLSVGFAGGLRF